MSKSQLELQGKVLILTDPDGNKSRVDLSSILPETIVTKVGTRYSGDTLLGVTSINKDGVIIHNDVEFTPLKMLNE